jgi:hypothetical protein
MAVSKSRKALREITDTLSEQLVRGWATLVVARQIDGAHDGQQLVHAQGFFDATYAACVESAILAFARLAISHKDSISVAYLLNCVQHSPSAFPVPEREAVMEAVSRHRTLLQSIQPLVERVREYRDRTIAHCDKKHVNHRDALASRPPVDLGEVERALALTRRILDAYRGYLDLPVLDLARLGVDLSEDWAYLLGLIEEDNRRP